MNEVDEAIAREEVAFTRGIDIDYIRHLVAKGGPSEEDDGDFNAWMARTHALTGGKLTEAENDELRQVFGTALSLQTMQGFIFTKPHGYAGDFEIIDRIYQTWISPDPDLANWDHFFHRMAAPRAVRNRKTYFHRLLDHYATDPTTRILKVGVGPGRSMYEWQSANLDSRVAFDCIEIDPKAIEYAAELNSAFADRIRFIRTNARRYKPTEHYNLIWAAGIFDYFDDDTFRQMVCNLLPALAPGGEIVIGNFSDTNPSRPFLEVGAWYLHHRGTDQLVRLAEECNVARERITIGCEPLGVNLFLHISA